MKEIGRYAFADHPMWPAEALRFQPVRLPVCACVLRACVPRYKEGKCAKNIINDTINLFFLTAVGISVISDHNSFRVLFDGIACV